MLCLNAVTVSGPVLEIGGIGAFFGACWYAYAPLADVSLNHDNGNIIVKT